MLSLTVLWFGSGLQAAAVQVGGRAGGDTLTAISLVLNVPAYQLGVRVDGKAARHYRIAVGHPDFPTPLGDFAISTVEWNPWWIPPASDWARGTVATPPGRSNPMGRVKLYFRTFYYLHGSPEEASIGHAESHGCVRLLNRDAIELALLVVRFGIPGPDSLELAQLAADTVTTRSIALEHSVPLRITYETVVLRGDSVYVYPDPYGLASATPEDRLLAVLDGAGFPRDVVDLDRLRTLLPRRVLREVALPLAELVRHPQ